jgi:Domain of unknown function (DUF3806)
MRVIALLVCLLLPAAYGEDEKTSVPTLTPEELSGYQFENKAGEDPVTVEDLSVGQTFFLDTQRREVKDLITRRLGILGFGQEIDDLKTIQQLVDRRLIKPKDVGEWQALGVVFGDILAKELDLHWISYEDDLGLSKALRWKKTENYVFPVTMFSRRVQFKEEIDAVSLFEKIRQEVAAFKAYERRNLPDRHQGSING